MEADAHAEAQISQRDGGRWKQSLMVLCIVASAALFGIVLDVFGVPGGTPWFGFWDALTTTSGQAYVAQVEQPTPKGAAARAGLHDGDRVDLRRVSVYDRFALVYQPVTNKTLNFTVERNGRAVPVTFKASTIYDGSAALKITGNALYIPAYFALLCCAWLIALRRSETREGRYLCLTLLAIVLGGINPTNVALPDATLSALMMVVWGVTTSGAAIFPVVLAMSFGRRSQVRTFLEFASFLMAAVSLAGFIIPAIGLVNLSIDPLPFVFGTFWRGSFAVFAFPVLTVVIATATTSRRERARTAWLLLPLPIALVLFGALTELQGLAPSYVSFMFLGVLANVMLLLGAVAVTFAMLRRRVVDVGFVISRTLVVAGVSGVVVVSFVLLEWLLGTVVSHVSHATGLIANASLALVLGLSMSFIHKRVDALVDFVLFHGRLENERALRNFAKEAAFVTQRDELLDHAIDKVRTHTDARAAAVLLDGDGRYQPARWFGNEPPNTSENDAAILALKAKHQPVDLHRYRTALHGDVALPMLARGRLFGVLLCGERAGGEAYAPDEIDALSEFAQGVGVALEAIDHVDDARARDDAILSELRGIREDLALLRYPPSARGAADRAAPPQT